MTIALERPPGRLRHADEPPAAPPADRTRLARLLRGPNEDAAWARPALLATNRDHARPHRRCSQRQS